jgi:ATP-binding cassette, subfamily B, multidrug efflux pump
MVLFRRLLPYLRPYWKQALVAPLLMLLEVAMDLAQPRLMQHIVDVGIAQLDMGIVVRTGLLMIGLAVVGMLGGVGNCVLGTRAAQNYGADLREDLFRKIQSLSFGNLDQLGTGELVTRLTNDVTQIQEVVNISLRILVRAPLMLFGSLVMMIITSPRLAVLLLGLVPIVLIGLTIVVKYAHALFGAVQKAIDGVNTVVQENLASVRVIKAFVRQDYERKRFAAANENLMARSIRAERTVALFGPFLMMALNLGVVGVVWFGGVDVTRGNAQIGQIMASINYLTTTLMSLMMVGMLLTRVSRAQASAERVIEVLDSQPLVVDAPSAVGELPGQGSVELERVIFSYGSDGKEPVLDGVDLQIRPGQTVAILGATGSGKSTLAHLIPRFYDVKAGRVMVDSLDVREIEQQALRSQVAIVMQEPFLFSGTIRDNLRYGRPEATDKEVELAAKLAQAHEFIMSFPDGYDTVLGQRGVNVSGGQKQRLAIARALVMRPAILILDDSTSSVDVETEALIQEALEENLKDCTRVVVAQRISTVLNADTIIVLEGARIAAQGTHEELIKTSPIYREIYESQLGNGVVVHG